MSFAVLISAKTAERDEIESIFPSWSPSTLRRTTKNVLSSIPACRRIVRATWVVRRPSEHFIFPDGFARRQIREDLKPSKRGDENIGERRSDDRMKSEQCVVRLL